MPRNRIFYIDNLRVTAIALVILLHLAVTYSHLGLWYYNEVRPLSIWAHLFFGLFQTFLQGFFMGMLFLVAGYFTPGALAKKGPVQFMAGRCWRLGLPALVYLLFVTPFVIWIQTPVPWAGNAASFSDFYRPYLLSAGFELMGLGPMWFAVALLIFSFIYALAEIFLPHRQTGQTLNVSTGRLTILILIITAGALMRRL